MALASLAEASLDELYEECAVLRKEFAELPEGTRSEEDDHAASLLTQRVTDLDHQITLAVLEERRAQQRLASTEGGGMGDGSGQRSFSDLMVTEDWIGWANSSASQRSTFQIEFDGQGTLQDMLYRAGNNNGISEWGSSGPGSLSYTGPGTVDTSNSGLLLPVGQPIAPVPRHARLFLRDLMPKMTTTLASIPYVQELNPTLYENASAVAEGGTKPNATLSFTGQKADPTVIAATLVISKQLFEDSAAVMQYINQRLPYIVAFKEDQEFLLGSGTWPDLPGITNQSNVQTYSTAPATTGDNAPSFGNSFAQIENHDGTPTAVVLNPTNAWNMFMHRAASGSGTFDAGTPFSALPLTVWGVPTYRTRAMALNSALVGDFQLGGMIVDREQVNVETYTERYAESNQVLLVCEERVGVMWFRPDLFVNVSNLS